MTIPDTPRRRVREQAEAVLAHARDVLGLRRVFAITSLDNAASIRPLGRLGFGFEGLIRLDDGDVRLFAKELGDG